MPAYLLYPLAEASRKDIAPSPRMIPWASIELCDETRGSTAVHLISGAQAIIAPLPCWAREHSPLCQLGSPRNQPAKGSTATFIEPNCLARALATNVPESRELPYVNFIPMGLQHRDIQRPDTQATTTLDALASRGCLCSHARRIFSARTRQCAEWISRCGPPNRRGSMDELGPLPRLSRPTNRGSHCAFSKWRPAYTDLDSLQAWRIRRGSAGYRKFCPLEASSQHRPHLTGPSRECPIVKVGTAELDGMEP